MPHQAGKFPTVQSLTQVKCPEIARGEGGFGSFGIDWYIIFQESGSKYDLSSLIFQERGCNLHKFCFHSQ